MDFRNDELVLANFGINKTSWMAKYLVKTQRQTFQWVVPNSGSSRYLSRKGRGPCAIFARTGRTPLLYSYKVAEALHAASIHTCKVVLAELAMFIAILMAGIQNALTMMQGNIPAVLFMGLSVKRLP